MNGHFTLPIGTTVSGSLTLDAADSVLSVWGAPRELSLSEGDVVTGIVDNQKPVSLMGCIPISSTRPLRHNGASASYEFFPHHVVIGSSQISYADDAITEVMFEIDDAPVLFQNNSFDILSPEPAQLSELIASQDTNSTRPVSVGENPVVSYYTDAGEGQIFSVETVIGKVSAHNEVTQYAGRREGAGFTKRIVVRVQFDEPIGIRELQSRMEQLLRFLGTVIGRPQNLLETKVRLSSEPNVTNGWPKYSLVHFSTLRQHERKGRTRVPDPQDVLIKAGSQSETFGAVLSAWLARDQDSGWRTARKMFFSRWSKGRSYDDTRLVSAANMYDHLPSSDFAKQVIQEILQSPIETFRQTLKALPDSPQRHSLLTALGSITAPKLKQKARFRTLRLVEIIGHMIPEVEGLIDAAINCRNYYVHGSGTEITRQLGPRFTFHLTDTLEFVFATSDLIEMGWDIRVVRPAAVGEPSVL